MTLANVGVFWDYGSAFRRGVREIWSSVYRKQNNFNFGVSLLKAGFGFIAGCSRYFVLYINSMRL